MLAYLRTCFISGLLVWLPIWITLLILKFMVDVLSNSLLLLPQKYHPDALLGVHIPGIGVFITLLVILLTGMAVANFIGKRLVALNDAIFARIPIVRSIYTGVKKVTQTLFSPGGQSFRKVLLVRFPHKDVWSIAFQTSEATKEIAQALQADSSMVCFFIPTTPNPTSGFLMMAPKSEVIELDMSVDQALKFVISLGVVQPDAPAAVAAPIIKKV
jgi:uncharacterized membrane protein